MKAEEQKIAESISSRAQVVNNQKFAKYKDKMLLSGVIAIVLVIALSGFLPKRKTLEPIEDNNKENASIQFTQNMALMNAISEQDKKLHTGYHGSNPNHPPILKLAKPSNTLSKETLARMNAPSTFFTATGSEMTAQVAGIAKSKTLIGRDVNSDFLNLQNDITSVSAKKLPHPNATVPAGEMIPATLETAINSELAGMARAITTRDIYAWSGDRLLIPKGSTVIGQFNTAISQGQSRIFVVWNRLQMTNGIIVSLNSPSTDSIGRSGQAADEIDRHFFERFGSGALLSVLGAYTAVGGVHGQDEYNSMSQYRMNMASSFQQAANQSLQQDMQTRPTLQVHQGTAINIFVAHDLDFYSVAGKG